jgi:hypothetical protein
MVLNLTPHRKQGMALSMQDEATALPLGITCRMSCLISANFVSVGSETCSWTHLDMLISIEHITVLIQFSYLVEVHMYQCILP